MNTLKRLFSILLGYCVAVSWVVGSFEVVRIAMHSKLPLGFLDGLKLSLVAWVWSSLVVLLAASTVGLLALVRPGFREHADAVARAVAWASMALVLSYVGPPAVELARSGDVVVALAFLFTTVGVGGVIWLNARFYLRRQAAGHPASLRWWQVCLGSAGLVCLLSSFALESRGDGGARGIPGDHNVLLVTADSLRRDHVATYSLLDGQTPRAQTPHLDSLAEQGVRFADAVTPMPDSASAHAALLSSLHPIRHGLLSHEHRLHGGFKTLPELLRQEGYATAAFVSSEQLGARTGLHRGFHIYDDEQVSWLRGVSELQVMSAISWFEKRLGQRDRGQFLSRPASQTTESALSWLERREDKPWMLWLHLADLPSASAASREPVASEKEGYVGGVEDLDGLVGTLLDSLETMGQSDNTAVIVTAPHGVLLGEHEDEGEGHLLDEELIRIPLLLHAPFSQFQGTVPQEVRLMDITPTVLALVGNEPLKKSEGENLLRYVNSASMPSMSCTLLSRQDSKQGAQFFFGLRTQDVKYIREASSEKEWLFNLKKDRAETKDISHEQPGTLVTAREVIYRERSSLEKSGLMD
jgi:arylsulfatase A-like enzyme